VVASLTSHDVHEQIVGEPVGNSVLLVQFCGVIPSLSAGTIKEIPLRTVPSFPHKQLKLALKTRADKGAIQADTLPSRMDRLSTFPSKR